jgi:hypothetical protein
MLRDQLASDEPPPKFEPLHETSHAFDNYIAGEWVAGATISPNRNP